MCEPHRKHLLRHRFYCYVPVFGRCLEIDLLYCWLFVAGLFTETFPSNGSPCHNSLTISVIDRRIHYILFQKKYIRKMNTLGNGLSIIFRSTLINDCLFFPRLPKFAWSSSVINVSFVCRRLFLLSWLMFCCLNYFHQEFHNVGGLSPLHSLECDVHTTLFALPCTIWNEKRVLRNQHGGVPNICNSFPATRTGSPSLSSWSKCFGMMF
jgi:hypothetical protein